MVDTAHLRGKADEQHGKADHRRIKRVLPETAVEVFAQEDGEDGADERYPPRRQHRQRQREQHGSDQHAAVAQRGVGFAPQPEHGGFKRVSGGDGERQLA